MTLFFLNLFVFFFFVLFISLWLIFGLYGERVKYYFNFDNILIVKNIESNITKKSDDLVNFQNFPSLADIAEAKLKKKYQVQSDIDEVLEAYNINRIEMSETVLAVDEFNEVLNYESNKIESSQNATNIKVAQEALAINILAEKQEPEKQEQEQEQEEQEAEEFLYSDYTQSLAFQLDLIYRLISQDFAEGFIDAETIKNDVHRNKFVNMIVAKHFETEQIANTKLFEEIVKELNSNLSSYINSLLIFDITNKQIQKNKLMYLVVEDEKKQLESLAVENQLKLIKEKHMASTSK